MVLSLLRNVMLFFMNFVLNATPAVQFILLTGSIELSEHEVVFSPLYIVYFMFLFDISFRVSMTGYVKLNSFIFSLPHLV